MKLHHAPFRVGHHNHCQSLAGSPLAVLEIRVDLRLSTSVAENSSRLTLESRLCFAMVHCRSICCQLHWHLATAFSVPGQRSGSSLAPGCPRAAEFVSRHGPRPDSICPLAIFGNFVCPSNELEELGRHSPARLQRQPSLPVPRHKRRGG